MLLSIQKIKNLVVIEHLKSMFGSHFIKRWGFVIIAVLFYFACTVYYMGPSVTSCTTTVYGFGDNTAGPIWKAMLPEHQTLLGSYTGMTNYPYGDNLYSPVGYSLITQSALIRGAMDIAGPICGYNLVNIVGFMLSSLVMFGFIYALTRKKWIALLAGYAAAFSPYYQMKVGGHPSYGFQAIFTGLIWLFFRILKYRQKRDAIYLGMLTAVAFYFDPYFVLLSTLVLVPLGLFWLFLNHKIFSLSFWSHSNKSEAVKNQFKLLLLTVGVAGVFIMPLVTILYTQGKQINATVAASRGNVLAEARACSNWPHEYLVPFVLNPIFETAFGKDRYIGTENFLRANFSCGIGEDSVGLSLTLITVVSLGTAVIFWEKINKRRTGLSKLLAYKPAPFIIGVVAIAFVAVAVGFPPLDFHHIPTPAYELLKITSTWRTLTRVYVLVNIALVVLASVALAYFAQHFSKNKRILIVGFILIFAGVFIEYQSFTPFTGNTLSTFNYNKDAPSAYTWLKTHSDIKTIAEYPLEREGGESDAGSYYSTMQSIHNKKLFNSVLSNSPQEEYKSGLKNLSDPQTVPVLHALGIDAVIVHGVTEAEVRTIPFVNVLYTAPQSSFNLLSHTPTVKNDNIVVISIKDAPIADFIIGLDSGFVRNGTIINSAADWQYEAIQNSVMKISKIANQRFVVNDISRPVCFDVKMSVLSDVDNLSLIADGVTVPVGQIDGTYRQVRANAINKVILHNDTGHNMRVTKIGCTLEV